MEEANPTFFADPKAFRNWLAKNHKTSTVLWVGYYKKATKIPSITWPESVDQALCYGWIDGLRRSIDDKAYMIRFTPRKTRSHWSDVNIKRIKALKKEGLVEKAGEAAFKLRKDENSRKASFEQKSVKLDEAYLSKIKADKAAWKYFQHMAPSIKKATIWWVISAKKEETRLKRLGILIECSANGEKIPPLRRNIK
jgi:uncharacterized protein YdeI (YjbR/CyaY-like superfamily)